MSPRVLGIAGGTASGKTTACRALVEALGDQCVLLTHDRYYHSLPEDVRHEPVRHNFDHPDALDTPRLVEDLQRLRAGHTTEVPRYDFATHARRPQSEWEILEPRPIVVVEGILVLAHPGLRAVMDHKVFVHAPDDIRLMRRIRRDMASRGRAVHDVLEQYERTVRPMHEQWVVPSRGHADLILDGTRAVAELVTQVMLLLEPPPAR